MENNYDLTSALALFTISVIGINSFILINSIRLLQLRYNVSQEITRNYFDHLPPKLRVVILIFSVSGLDEDFSKTKKSTVVEGFISGFIWLFCFSGLILFSLIDVINNKDKLRPIFIITFVLSMMIFLFLNLKFIYKFRLEIKNQK